MLFFFKLISVLGQEKEDLSILKNTKNWKKEIIKFPIDWAPNLKLKGFEELLFSPKWSDKKSDQFWSLVISWSIEAKENLSKKQLEYNLKSYFDGLMKPNHWAKDFPDPEVSFIKNYDHTFNGKMTFFDGFYSGKIITVNIQVEQTFCENNNKTIIIFRLSPKEKRHKIWKTLNELELNEKLCN
ncbi:hypothetical protein [Polaribacter sp. Hel1_85]|uniref:hypothetical protein n=1 Tax=Polaribacter sp. Hel1_85 TaxID=1250005 RepID=UPI00052BCB86|nr:hypothetical protein [Polaribacter sp. Hel1_85]KGL62588.1 hypothetical protein PHEL85_2382 [Polaribacter sp. Hel1_85]